jgi:hypothetical protein
MAFVQLAEMFGGGQEAGGQAPDTGGPNPSGMSFTPLTQMFGQAPAQQPVATPAVQPPTQSAQPNQVPSTTQQPQFQPQSLAQPDSGQELGQTLGQANSLVQRAGKLGEMFSPGITKNVGGSGLNLSDVGGPLSLAGGIAKQDPWQIVGGTLSSAGTLARLADMPALSATVGSLGGPLSLARGIINKDPMSIASGALSTYGAVNNLVTQFGATALPSFSTAFATAFPELASAIASSFGGTAAAAASEAALAAGATAGEAAGMALSAAAAGIGAAAAPVIMAITSWIQNNEEVKAMSSGWWNNPIKGQLTSAATAGVSRANQVLDQINQVGLDKVPTQALMGSLPSILNNLQAYYATAQGGRGAIKASDTLTGGTGGAKSASQGQGAIDAYTKNFTNAHDAMVGVVQGLLDRGVSYEELGKLPVSGDWAMQSLDAGGGPEEYYAKNQGKYDADLAQIVNRLNEPLMVPEMRMENVGTEGSFDRPVATGRMVPGPGGVPAGISVPEMLTAALGASRLATDANTHASGLMTGMYGGPLWAALARMGNSNPAIQKAIQDHFDPWFSLRTWTAEQMNTALMPIMSVRQMQQAERDAYNPGGGGPGDGSPGAY